MRIFTSTIQAIIAARRRRLWMLKTYSESDLVFRVARRPSKFGVRGCLGTDVMPLDVFAEAQAAALRATDSGQPIDLLHFLANGHRLASEAFGATVGPLQPGSVADLLVLDYQPPTPLEARTLAAHVQFGLSGRLVESVMVDGLWRLWKRKALSLDALAVARASAEATRAVWQKLA
jgi:cytosine/adenosine deaminase-related metal-dependent hydrolase